MEFGPHLESLEFQAARGVRIKALEERPLIESGNEWIWQAFNRLSTSRSDSMSGRGPIPYLGLVKYAEEMEIGPGQREFLWDVLKKLDEIYLKELARRSKPPPTPPSPTPRR